ncbi:hypothetical protein JTB14_031795 [Gonioctena quinquepunctata]|nr:hypothetical protein JTB14_031795 [Gonioctena quinquepunctata]
MRIVFSHPLGPLPWALAATDGTIKKTNIPKLFKLLSENCPPADVIPENAANIIDEIPSVQQRVEVPNTFGPKDFKDLFKDRIHESILLPIRTEVHQ